MLTLEANDDFERLYVYARELEVSTKRQAIEQGLRHDEKQVGYSIIVRFKSNEPRK